MTIENASSFLAWNVSSYLATFLIIAFIIVASDHFFMGGAALNKPTTKKFLLTKWLYFACFLRLNKSEKYHHRSKAVQLCAEFYPVLLLVFLLRGFIAEPFRIPSNSMMPTFLTYDFLLVEKLSYGIHLPVFNTELIDINDPERGDVIVFRYPNYEHQKAYKGADFIKRVIGIPGDKIEYINDKLTVNGTAIKYKNIGTYKGIEKGTGMTGYKHKREMLAPNPHNILLSPNTNSRNVKLIVPQGHYFVMGDNRAHSSDSRFWGFVPEQYIIGRAFYIWAHADIGGIFSANPLQALKTFTLNRNGIID
ncbi:signal peptidase I [Candidatus Thiodubiliella endoseptemdiera]|uniref:signal peptidase I n=1 Tax=Candidatus Thiodubiliella endoseptemdiera TaxID=2738886 RepID=UPI0034DE5390